MLEQYVPLILLAAFLVFNAVLLIGLSHLLSATRRTAVKSTPYESGIPVLGTARERFSVKFYLVAMLFIIFDIETVFMIPWAAGFRQLKDMTGLLVIEMFIFIAILAIGYVYIWKRGALEWD
jgi:NADH-quinone oxidoreductase subunit A